ncbi:MAG: hypothetical protein IJ562_08520 [Prevotella sp.]|nr:hypothetical protein [Prevotella sp.]
MRPKDLSQRYATQLTCRCCGQELPAECFERFPTGTYRHVCRKCQYQIYVRPRYEARRLSEIMQNERT